VKCLDIPTDVAASCRKGFFMTLSVRTRLAAGLTAVGLTCLGLVAVSSLSMAATTPGDSTGTPPASYPNPAAISGSVGAHDPTVVKRPDGTYLVATTGHNVPLKTSRDRKTWTSAGSAFNGTMSWVSAYTTGDVWAPDLSYHNGQYYLYYAASSFGSLNSAIFLATSTTGNAGTWTNRGLVISTSGSSDYNAIDADLIVDRDGRWWLALGSFWSGLKLIAINPTTGQRSGSAMYSLASRPNNAGAVEAADIWERGGYYYLFASFDTCCQGAASTYRIMVGRSTSITGPYVDRSGTVMTNGGGTQVLAGHGNIHGPGHSATLRDPDGDYLFYHWYTDSGGSQLGINRLGYDVAGWPYVY
jgi:arabinan endo-1,5-alpha-L-arabinosidase